MKESKSKNGIRNFLLISGLSLGGLVASSYLIDRLYDKKPVESKSVYDVRIGTFNENNKKLDGSYIIKYHDGSGAIVTILDDIGLPHD